MSNIKSEFPRHRVGIAVEAPKNRDGAFVDCQVNCRVDLVMSGFSAEIVRD